MIVQKKNGLWNRVATALFKTTIKHKIEQTVSKLNFHLNLNLKVHFKSADL
jgi:hypothetical protein